MASEAVTKTLVRFIDVGRGKKSWSAEIHTVDGELDADDMFRSIKKAGALMSNDIDLTGDGDILVGGFRPVGRFELVTHPT